MIHVLATLYFEMNLYIILDRIMLLSAVNPTLEKRKHFYDQQKAVTIDQHQKWTPNLNHNDRQVTNSICPCWFTRQ